MKPSTGPNKREQAAAARRARLLEAALQLFSEVGIERATTKMLAERVGMSPGLLYHYFASKEELVQAVVDGQTYQSEIDAIYEAARDMPVEQALQHLCWEFLWLHWNHKEALWVFFREMHTNPQVGPLMKSSWARNNQQLADFFRDRMQRGELVPHEPRVAAHLFFSSIYLVHLMYGRDPEFLLFRDNVEGIRGYVRLQAEILLNGLKTQTP